VVATLAVTGAFAQSSGSPAVHTDSDQQTGLAEIVVTAQRREERLQDVPISVSAFDANTLKAAGVNRIYDLNKLDPSINISIGQGPVEPIIRGSGSILDAAGNEGSAAIYIDGVYIARPMPEMFSFEQDIDHVELLKGPQGTLFGRNSSAGLVNIITRTPVLGAPLNIEGTVGYGNFNTRDVSGYLSSGLGEHMAFDISAYYNDQIGGWGQNELLDTKVGFGWRQGVRSKFVAEFTDTTKLTVSGDYVRSATNRPFATAPGTTAGNPLYGIVPGSPPASIPAPFGFWDTQTNYPYHWTTKSYSFTARLDQELPFANFVSISGYRRTEMDFHDAGNSLPFDGLNEFTYQLEENAWQYSQEFQILSKPGSTITWVAGAYYLDSRDGYEPTAFQGVEFGPVNVDLVGITEVKSYAAFGQATIPVAPKLDLTLGLRETVDHSTLFGYTDITTIGPDSNAPYLGGAQILREPDVVGSQTWKKLTWRGALDYKLSEDALLYGSVSRGFKGGEFGTLPAVATPINPETTDAYEVGFKTEELNRTVLVNGALFWNDIKDPQVDYIRNQNVLLVNAQSARVKGAELQLGWKATQNLQLRFSATALDAKYVAYANVPYDAPSSKLVNGVVPGCSTPATYTPAAGYPSIPVNPLQGGNVDFCSGNGNGNYLPRASKFAYTAGFDFSLPVGSDRIVFSPNLAYNSGFYWLPDNTFAQRPIYLLDGQVKYVIGEGRFQVRAWGRNLTNKGYSVNAYEEGQGAGYVQQPAPPRTFGVNFDFKL
jgi:iron complex outermembrane recepter protein